MCGSVLPRAEGSISAVAGRRSLLTSDCLRRNAVIRLASPAPPPPGEQCSVVWTPGDRDAGHGAQLISKFSTDRMRKGMSDCPDGSSHVGDLCLVADWPGDVFGVTAACLTHALSSGSTLCVW